MNIIELYEQDLEQRDLTESSRRTYWNDAAKVLEALVGVISVGVIEAYIEEWGARGDYGTAIRRLKAIALERRSQVA